MLHKNDHIRPAHKDGTVRSLIPEKISECSLSSTGGPGVCSSAEVVASVRTYLEGKGHVEDHIRGANPDSSSAAGIIEDAKKVTGCSTEQCVVKTLEEPIVRLVGQRAFEGNLANNFKIAGPTDNAWLSNVNIDGVLAQWATKFPRFFPYNFNMRNYMDYSFKNNILTETPDTLATVSFCDLYKKGFNCAACVVNNDKYQGGGTHWMAIFVDAREPPRATCEFFNSSGNDPVPEFVSYLVKTARCIEGLPSDNRAKWKAEIIRVTRRRHQQSTTECGLYSLFYIWARLHGVPYTYFVDNPIDDQLMFEFRYHLFANDQTGHKFDWGEFMKKVKVDWE